MAVYADPKSAAVLPVTFRLKFFPETFCFQKPFQLLSSFRHDIGLLLNVRDAGDELLGALITEHPRQCGIGAEVTAFRRRLKDPFGGVLKDTAILCLRFPQRL